MRFLTQLSLLLLTTISAQAADRAQSSMPKVKTFAAAKAACSQAGLKLINLEEYIKVLYEDRDPSPFVKLIGSTEDQFYYYTWIDEPKIANDGPDTIGGFGDGHGTDLSGIGLQELIKFTKDAIQSGRLPQQLLPAANALLKDTEQGVAPICY
jgi:hypothetical protein